MVWEEGGVAEGHSGKEKPFKVLATTGRDRQALGVCLSSCAQKGALHVRSPDGREGKGRGGLTAGLWRLGAEGVVEDDKAL